jgi:hypothetical protein
MLVITGLLGGVLALPPTACYAVVGGRDPLAACYAVAGGALYHHGARVLCALRRMHPLLYYLDAAEVEPDITTNL